MMSSNHDAFERQVTSSFFPFSLFRLPSPSPYPMAAEGSEIANAKLPVTLLGGFLGAGKTTLLKHILESKQGDEKFRCAVIVNDMAELNIDKDLIDKTGFIQSEEVIAMQNGCVCCTLKGDLSEQIIELCSKKIFDYMIIESSGVSEPGQIAAAFAPCKDTHDHEEAHKTLTLNDVARLDTCVTVIDSAEFLDRLESVIAGPSNENFPQLMVAQIEYSNLILLNKTDLVSKEQLAKITDQIQLLNSKAKILTTHQSTVDVKEVVNTGLHDASEFDFLDSPDPIEKEEVLECCKASQKRGETPCCKRARTIDSGKSQVLLPSKQNPKTRHETLFGLTSFLYKSRRPLHIQRFHSLYVEKYYEFIEKSPAVGGPLPWVVEEEEKQKDEARKEEEMKARQEEAIKKRGDRTETFGQLMRSKGYLWFANFSDYLICMSQAGNSVEIDSMQNRWTVLQPEGWVGTEKEREQIRKGWVSPYGDRRQEIVFIGSDLNHKAIQNVLDQCLLTDEEYEKGVDYWKAVLE